MQQTDWYLWHLIVSNGPTNSLEPVDPLTPWIQWFYWLLGSNGPINSLDGRIQLVWLSQVWGLGFLFKFLLLCVCNFFISSNLDSLPSAIFENHCLYPSVRKPGIRKWKTWQFKNISVEAQYPEASLHFYACTRCWAECGQGYHPSVPLRSAPFYDAGQEMSWGWPSVLQQREGRSGGGGGVYSAAMCLPFRRNSAKLWHLSSHLIFTTTLWGWHYTLVKQVRKLRVGAVMALLKNQKYKTTKMRKKKITWARNDRVGI